MVQARCCCGALVIELSGDPALNGVCHCDNCRRRTGSAFGWSVYFPEAALAADESRFAAYVFESASGRQERRFCPTCGSTVYWRSAAFAGLVGVAGGCLTADALGEPSISATDAHRLAWLTLPDTLQRWG
jgi:hypothetical protein